MAVTNAHLEKLLRELISKNKERSHESQQDHLRLRNAIEKVDTKLSDAIVEIKETKSELEKLKSVTIIDDDSIRNKVTKNVSDIAYIKNALERQKSAVWKVALSVVGTVISAIVLFFIFGNNGGGQ